jgi:hypothetical protein
VAVSGLRDPGKSCGYHGRPWAHARAQRANVGDAVYERIAGEINGCSACSGRVCGERVRAGRWRLEARAAVQLLAVRQRSVVLVVRGQ